MKFFVAGRPYSFEAYDTASTNFTFFEDDGAAETAFDCLILFVAVVMLPSAFVINFAWHGYECAAHTLSWMENEFLF